MNPVTSPQRSSTSNLIAGIIGGAVVLIVGAILIATGVIDTGDTTKVVRETSSVPAGGTSNAASGGRSVEDIYKREGKSVVFIEARGVTSGDSTFGQQSGTATGSGFVVDKDGTILTNAHVVEGSSDVSVRFDENGKSIDAQVKGRDPSTDLAVLKVNPDDVKNIRPIDLGDSSKTRVGEPVVAIGNPFGFTRTVTTGIVSALARKIEAPNGFQIGHVIQTDASINPGNSGGPLLDENGRVIGITSQIATGGGQGSVGIGFAIPINTAKGLLPKLKQGGSIQRAYLGVNMTDVTAQLARDLNLPVKTGALIQSVVPGGPAADAGLKGGSTSLSSDLAAGGDVIVGVDGKSTPNGDAVSAAISRKKPGDTVNVQYYRGNKKKTAKVKLGKRPSQLQQDSSSGSGGGPNLIP